MAGSKLHISYNQIHQLIDYAVKRFRLGDDYSPDLMIAIGGGGFIPARILRSFLKAKNGRNIPIQAIGLSLYEELPNAGQNGVPEVPGVQVTKTQWLNFGGADSLVSLLGRKILIVDEVDDSRKTLVYAVAELLKDIRAQEIQAGMNPGESNTEIGIFVVYNKDKPKAEELPESVMRHYYPAATTPDRWLFFPWDCTTDIGVHTELSKQDS
ncbi:hypoxanthine-guanine phosphoribosyltransferase [Coemansia sp. S610]|uniref:Hypoxanthine-guanine phosphoribosyltransferase n=1 Tax=Coemansia spiralis TaxID=417178 RepID=A0A9W8L3B5_9FUNG|nr:hypoxanthine-guanine phosphoribosyltransferase [Coemansia sp. RSA 2675]KAJ2023328.1 hypoxanthine-guanine phosphoribosyltransferase [Coemansia sp. S610]KAJ2362128.1 hypoxanthine-guanine phosphoribosyltransferase [Coemansia sp. RSA 2611]KAJ2404683.1 hypoxanthine-guanine phosphoribosyltransferase [Coemansia sp. RSA 2530]KAJ2686264.1 hypoxanthine-guanine phosphoribosyltransferase [Coemansia spiralis]KAJ2695602.1 hypoxanthine-guanine phosphoribosyltransferase [Coemansia sp. IMI 209128]